jgi:hypothetical protein
VQRPFAMGADHRVATTRLFKSKAMSLDCALTRSARDDKWKVGTPVVAGPFDFAQGRLHSVRPLQKRTGETPVVPKTLAGEEEFGDFVGVGQ